MKHINEQIKFIDTKLLPLFGLKNIVDYDNFIKCEINKDEENLFIKKINDLLSDIKTIFPVKRFNLHKTDNKILSYKQSINILKMCLEIANINYILDKFNDKKILRLNTTNLFLYRYIEKMNFSAENTDLRQNFNNEVKKDKNIFDTIHFTPINTNFATPGSREPHKTYTTYTNDDLKNQTKTTNTKHISLCFRNFIEIDNGKKIFKLSLKLFHINNIYSIKFSENEMYDIKKNNVVTKYYILSNQYGYLIDGEFNFNKNLIPNDIIIPLNLSLYSDLSLFIPLFINDANYDLINSLQFDIELGETIFYKPFQEKLLNEKDSFLTQNFDDKTLLYDFNRGDFVIQKNNILCMIKQVDNDNFITIENNEYETNKIKIGSLDGFEIPYTSNVEKPNLLWLLVQKNCDFVRTTFMYTPSLSKYDKFTKTCIFSEKIANNKYKHILDISFIRIFDSIDDIKITPLSGYDNTPLSGYNNFNVNNLKLFGIFLKGKNNEIIEFNLKHINIKDKKGDRYYYVIKELENKQITLPSNYGFTLRFIYESNNSKNILEYTYFFYNVYMYKQELRRSKLCKPENLLFEPLKVENE